MFCSLQRHYFGLLLLREGACLSRHHLIIGLCVRAIVYHCLSDLAHASLLSYDFRVQTSPTELLQYQ